MSLEETPYNDRNRLVGEKEIQAILQAYDVNLPINDINIYRKAFVHKSYCTRKNENFLNGNTHCPANCLPLQEESNERLEFLGDSVLNIVIADYLFERYPDENEGFLTRMRTKLVNGKMLAHLSREIGLAPYVILSKQIDENEGRKNLNILEDAFEAFIAAIYSDHGFHVAKKWIISVIENNLDFVELIKQNNNYKDILLKHYQQNYSYTPKFYEVNVDSSSMNQKTYTICVKDNNDNILGVGKGASKKEGENMAAYDAIRSLGIQ
jgi:ribonuclease III